MGGLEGRGVVGSVAGHGHDLAVGLQGLDQPLLVERSRPGYDFKIIHAVAQLGVAQLCELRTCDDVAGAVAAVVPKADLAAYLLGRPRCVAGYDLELDPGVQNGAHRVGNIAAHRIGYRHDAEEHEIFLLKASPLDGRFAGRQFLVGEAERAHRLVLILQQPGVEIRARHACRVAAHSEHNLGRSLDVQQPAPVGRFNHRGHVFAFCREGEFLQTFHAGAQRPVVGPPAVQPQKQRSLRGITQYPGRPLRPVKLRRGIDSNSLADHLVRGIAEKVGVRHLHAVLRQCAGLVGAYHRGGAHGLAGMHLANQIVGAQHGTHAVGQR